MALSALAGQPRATQILGSALASGRIHHAYLFAGPMGVGKTLAAQLFAQATNCESPAAMAAAENGLFIDDPCGNCPSCKKINEEWKKHNHPLVMWIDTEAEMAAHGLYESQGDRTPAKAIGVRLLRELVIPRLALLAVGGRRKVAIFKDVDFNEPAQNAFLKTLEEPPRDTTFIILSSAPDALKPTIRSRCMRVPFQPLEPGVVADRVAKARKVDPDRARLLAALSGGNLGLALTLDEKAIDQRRQLIESVEQLAGDDWVGWLALAEALDKREPALAGLEILNGWYQDVLRVAGGAEGPLVNVDLVNRCRAAASKLGPREVLRRLKLLELATWGIERNQAPRLWMERTFLAFNGITPLGMAEE